MLKTYFQQLFNVALAAVALSALTSCYKKEDWSWTEQVRFSDGSDVEIQRLATRVNIGKRLDGGDPHPLRNQSFAFAPAGVMWDQSKPGIRLDSLPQKPVGVSYPDEYVKVVPFSFDRVGGRYIMVGTPLQPDALLNYCIENPSMYNAFFFSWANNTWVQADQSDELLDTATANLLWEVNWGYSYTKPQVLDLAEKSRRGDLDYSKPISVRQFLALAQHTCLDLDHSRGYHMALKAAN